MSMHEFLSVVSFIALYGVSYGIVLFTISIGLVVMMGLMRVINLAHGAFAALGGYLAASLMNHLSIPFWFAVPLAVVAVAVFSVLVERLFYVHLYTASDLDQVLLTVGLAFVAVAGLNFVFGPNVYPAKLPDVLTLNVDFGIRKFQMYRLFLIADGAVLFLVLWYIFDRTNFGARLRAAVDNRGMAEAIGIDVPKMFSLVFALGCGLAALGGALGYAILPLEPLYPFKYLVLVLIVVSLSDFGNIKTAAGVAIFLGVADTGCRYLFPNVGAFIIYGILISLIVRKHAGLYLGRRSG
jgi:branched-chain amino acid transport system permease protein